MIRSAEELSPFEQMALIDISYSRLDTYEMCPSKYFYTYIQQEDRVFGAAATLGTIVHGVLEEVVGDELDLTDMLILFDQERSKHDPDHNIEQDLIDVGHHLLTEFVDRHADDTYDIVGKELPFSMVIGSARVSGYIDCVERMADGSIRITDYKAQPLDTPILTPTGWVKMGDIQVGDYVVGVNGKPTKVVGVYPQGIVPAYRVSFSDKSSTVCSKEHLWDVDPMDSEPKVLPLNQIGALRKGGNYRYATPTVAPIEFSQSTDLPIHPYILGVILGDGGTTGTSLKIHCVDPEIRERVDQLLPYPLRCKDDWKKSWRISSSTRRNSYVQTLKSMNLWGVRSEDKFVPEQYLRSSVQDRIELLRGLMDTDGGCSTRTEFRTTSPFLRDAVLELCRSLGGTPTFSAHQGYRVSDGERINGRTCYVVNTRVPVNPFYLSRKALHWHAPKRDTRRRITNIVRIPDQPMQCIKVENEDGLYVTENYIVTHNTGKWEFRGEPRDNLQLGIYALAANYYYPDTDIYAELYYLRSGRRKGALFTPELLAQVEQNVVDRVMQIIEDRNFSPTKDIFPCRFCDFRQNGVCPVGVRRIGK